MKIELTQFNSPCSCGKTHSLYVKDIVIKSNAIKKIPTLLQKDGYKQPVIICDYNTYTAAAEQLLTLLPATTDIIILNPNQLHADEHGVNAAQVQLSVNTDLLIAVGAGTIHDITRYVAYHKQLPFYSVPTAASVDGFVSTVAAMTWHGFKKSFTAVSPVCVIADTDIFSKAPFRLTASGVADLLGKYTALTDWKISHLITGEPLCSRICEMEEEAIHTVVDNLSLLQQGDFTAYESLMYALLLSGLAMQMVGNSRPASGAEHHLSHLWEMGLLNKQITAYHGEKVGVGLVVTCEMYHNALQVIKSGQYALTAGVNPKEEIETLHCDNQTIIQELLCENTPNPLDVIQLDQLKHYQEEIEGILETLPKKEEIERFLHMVNAPTTLKEIGLPESIKESSIQFSPYVRKRITFMRLLKLYHLVKEEVK